MSRKEKRWGKMPRGAGWGEKSRRTEDWRTGCRDREESCSIMQRLRQELRRLADEPLPLPPSLKDKSREEEEEEEERKTKRYVSNHESSFAQTMLYGRDGVEEETRTSNRSLLKLGEEELGLLKKYNISIPSLNSDDKSSRSSNAKSNGQRAFGGRSSMFEGLRSFPREVFDL
eukprot:751172-Hanusia_phi.AAC.10